MPTLYRARPPRRPAGPLADDAATDRLEPVISSDHAPTTPIVTVHRELDDTLRDALFTAVEQVLAQNGAHRVHIDASSPGHGDTVVADLPLGSLGHQPRRIIPGD